MGAMTKIVFGSLPFFFAAAFPSVSPPTDNPVVSKYGNSTSLVWTNAINWTNVVSVSEYNNDIAAAQSALLKSSHGGGVVFLPAGEYQLKDNFVLASNVVLRGEPDTNAANDGKKPGKLKPRSQLKCPDRQHIGILNTDPDATNIGVVNLFLDGCAIMFWPSLGPKEWSMKEYWYYATTVKGMGTNKIVLGNVVQNVNLANSNPSSNSNDEGDGWPWKFSTAIAVYSDQNALIANNLLPAATAKATMELCDGKKVPYPYDNRYGIDVNRVLLGGVFGHLVPGATPGRCTDAKTFPWSFRPGLDIRDNYVFGNGRVGVSFSGGGDGKTKGSGTQVSGNHVEHAADTTFYGFEKCKPPRGSDTNENRGYDQAGVENNVTHNTGHIHRQKVFNSSYSTVDGEGILVQCSNGNNQYRNIWDSNDLSGGTSGYIAYYNVAVVEDCDIINNKVNKDQAIGLLDDKGNSVKDLHCSGNSPKADCKATKGGTTD